MGRLLIAPLLQNIKKDIRLHKSIDINQTKSYNLIVAILNIKNQRIIIGG